MPNSPINMAISGKRYSGKSTLGLRLAREFGGYRSEFAESLKYGLQRLGVEVDGPDKDRQTLQEVGLYFREKHPDWWVDQLDINTAYDRAKCGVVIEDMRFPNELDWCLVHGFYTIRLEVSPDVQYGRARAMGVEMDDLLEERPSLADRLLRRPDARKSQHVSETALDQMPFRFNQVINTDWYDADQVFNIASKRLHELFSLEQTAKSPYALE